MPEGATNPSAQPSAPADPASDQWHYAKASKPHGPIDVGSLRAMLTAGELAPTTPVWRRGMVGWEPACHIAELGGTPQSHAPTTDPIASVVPYRNAAALAGYYCSVFALIPAVGMLLGPIAIVLGARGLKVAKRNPHAKGKAHAIVAITLGSFVTLAHLGVIALIALAAGR
jgi:hypothetical protein